MQVAPRRSQAVIKASMVAVAASLLIAGAASGGQWTRTDAAPSATKATHASSVLRVAVTQAPDPFDPATLADNRSIELAQNVFDGLVDVNDAMKVVPAIAKSWKITGGGTVYTFNLRHGVHFQNGDLVTAKDFVYSWNRALSPKVASPDSFFLTNIKGADAVTKGKATTATGLKATGKFTLRVTLTGPAGYFPSLVSRWPAWVIDSKDVKAHPTTWDAPGTLNGTGAYKLVRAVGDSQYIFQANPSYFNGAPKIREVQVSVVPNATAAVARYQANEFDAVLNLDSPSILQVQKSSSLKSQFHSRPLLRTVWLGMGYTTAPFNNRNVRLAFNHAIDKAALVKVALAGQATPAVGWLPPGVAGNVASSRKDYSYDPELGKSLLAQAGYGSNGKAFPTVALTYSLATGETEQAFEFIQNQLQQNLGIHVTLKQMPANAFNAAMSNPKQRPSLWGYSFGLDYPDAQEQTTYLGITGAGYNFEAYSNKKYDALVNAANASSNQAKRAALYRQSENIRLNDAVDVPLYYPNSTWLVKPSVKGFGASPLYSRKWFGMSIGN